MSKAKGLVFAGTFEGHKLALYTLEKGYEIDFSVATEYGKEILSDLKELSVIEGRLDSKEIENLIIEKEYSFIIDATHPYATVVTENILNACSKTKCKYYRLVRKDVEIKNPNVILVNSIDEAVDFLNHTKEKALLTTGSKEINKFASVINKEERLFPRVLPSQESIILCENAGIPKKNIICMQGPFIKEMNIATLEQYKCNIMVTKNTGKPGGLEDKIACASDKIKVVVINKPKEEDGLDFNEIKDVLEGYYGRL